VLQPYDADQLPGDIDRAWNVRPELRYLDLQIQEIEIELAAAENMLQPRIDARLEASKDIGAPADPKGDKTPFELEAGLWGEVPLQRRQACGKIQSLRGKISQLSAKREYSADKVATEVRDAVSALQAAAGRIQRARTTADLARQSLELGRRGFESGDLTVVTLNLYEQAVLDADLQLIEAQADYFKARAAFRAAIAADVTETD
jgi:outer membrane protein TolC